MENHRYKVVEKVNQAGKSKSNDESARFDSPNGEMNKFDIKITLKVETRSRLSLLLLNSSFCLLHIVDYVFPACQYLTIKGFSGNWTEKMGW